MKKQMRWIIVGLLLLSLSSIACSLSGGDDGETAVDTITNAAEEAASEAVAQAAGAEAVAEAAGAIAEAGGAEAVADLAAAGETINTAELGDALDLNRVLDGTAVQSYQYDMQMNIHSDKGDGETTILMLYRADPKALSMEMNFSGAAFAEDTTMGDMKMTQIGDTVYMDLSEMGCMQMPANESNLTDDMMGNMFGSEMVDDLETLVKVGDETVNGVDTTHYTFDESAYLTADAGVKTAVGHIYIAKDGGYMVRMTIDTTGNMADFFNNDDAADGTMHIEMNLTHINEPVQINPPDDCESLGDTMPFGGGADSAADVDYPLTDDATNIFSMEGITSYSTAMSVADVQAFYQGEMPASGWIENADMNVILDDAATLVFDKDGQSMTLAINNDPNAATSVMIIVMDK